jgi:hypothetical protein
MSSVIAVLVESVRLLASLVPGITLALLCPLLLGLALLLVPALAGLRLSEIGCRPWRLHWQYFESRASVAVPLFASTFAIGLFFGLLYQRSGNLWIVAIFHAFGNAYIVSSVGTAQ